MKRISRLLLGGTAALSLVLSPLVALTPASAAISQNPYYFDGMITPELVDGEYRTAFPNWDNYTKSWFFADHDSGRVVKFDSDGNYLKSFGNPGPEQVPLNYPHDVGVNSQGYTFVSDSESVKAFDAQGNLVAKDVYFNGEVKNGNISGTHIATDDLGNAYACVFDYTLGSTIVKLAVAQGHINAQQVIPGGDTCAAWGGSHLEVSPDGAVILASGSRGTLVWANIGGTWSMTHEFPGPEWSAHGNFWLSELDGTYEVDVLTYDRTLIKTYDPITGELLKSTPAANTSGFPFAKNRSSYFRDITQFVLSGPNSFWVQSQMGLISFDFLTQNSKAFGVTKLGSVNKVTLTSDDEINFSDYLGNLVTVNRSGVETARIQLEHVPSDVSSVTPSQDGKLFVTYTGTAGNQSTSALLDSTGKLISDYGMTRGLTALTPTSTGSFPSIRRVYSQQCQVLNQSNGTYIYYGSKFTGTAISDSCDIASGGRVQIVQDFAGPNETFRSVSLNVPETIPGALVGSLAIAPNGNILLARESRDVVIFDPSGNYLGNLVPPRFTIQNEVGTMAFDSEGTLYMAYGAGVARFKAMKTFTLTPRPTIVGKASVGATVACDAGIWDAAATLGYQWLRDGVAIAGATGANYVASGSDYGHSLSVQVTGSGSGYSAVVVTSSSKIVTPGVLSQTSVPQVIGTFETGKLLEAVPGAWDPKATLGYQWLRDGEAILSANLSTYSLTAQDAGRSISVQVTGTATGYSSVSTTSSANAIALGVQPGGGVEVSGTYSVGKSLTARVSNALDSASFVYQWLRDGVEIAGASSESIELTSADLNHSISVSVVVSAIGYKNLAYSSVAQQVVAGTIAGTRTAALDVEPDVGKQVSVNTFGAANEESLSYQWLLNGEVIAGATDRTFIPAGSDYGKSIQAQVVFSRPGYSDLVVATKPHSIGLSKESQGLNLGGLDLKNTDLTFYNFKDANLAGANFYSANLSYVNFKGANLTGVNLAKANLTFADFSATNLTDADLSNGNAAFTLFVGATMRNTNVTGLALDGRDFSQVDLSGVKGVLATAPSELPEDWTVVANRLAGPSADLSGADFSGASLKGLNLSGANLTNANLVGADLSGTNLSQAKLTGASFHPKSTSSTSISGTPKVGFELYIQQTSWTKGLSYSYQWYKDGVAIAGATAPTLVATASQAGRRLSLTVVAKYLDVTIGSVTTPSVIVAPGLMTTKALKLSGSVKVNSTIKSTVTAWIAGAKLSYQWYLDGKAIKGATASSYKLLKAQKGHLITVRVTQSAAGYSSATVTSNAVKVS